MTREERKQKTLESFREAARIARALVAYCENLELDRSEYPLDEFADDDQMRFAGGTKEEIGELAFDKLGITPEDVEEANEVSSTSAVEAIAPEDQTMGCADALSTLVEAVETAHCVEGLPDELEKAVRTVQRILEQKGCEDFDKAVEDGALTTLMDVVVFG